MAGLSNAQTAVPGRTRACRRRFSATARAIARFSNEPRNGLWMSPTGSRGSSPPCTWRSIGPSQVTLDAVLARARFWQRFAGLPMNARQIRVLYRLLDRFEGKLTTGKWAAVAKCSSDTALRDIGELLSRGHCKVDTRGPQHELRACRTLSRTPGLRLQRNIQALFSLPIEHGLDHTNTQKNPVHQPQVDEPDKARRQRRKAGFATGGDKACHGREG